MNGYNGRTSTIEQESVVDLIKDLRDESVIMVRQQVELMKTEFSEKVSRVTKNSSMVVLGGALVLFGVLFLLAGLTFLGYVGLVAAGVAPATAIWLMPIITGVVVGIIGGILLGRSISKLKKTSVVPEKTVHSIKEDQQWLKQKRK